MWIVVCDHGDGKRTPYGPIPQLSVATEFAKFLSEEVDPARVYAQDEVDLTRAGMGQVESPVAELLRWREAIALPAIGGVRW